MTSRADGSGAVAERIAQVRQEWLDTWMPKLTSEETPLSPYRVIWDLLHTVEVAETIITHDAGSPRDQLSPFWVATEPLSYLGWGKTTQLGYGLGLAMGAKLARPEKLCVNVWGDAAIGFTGMDFETAVRERIPILSILLNNFSMAIELPIMQAATEKYRSTDISGDYAAFARALGGYGERVTDPGEIVPAIRRGIERTRGRNARAARVHHRQGDRVLDAGLAMHPSGSSMGGPGPDALVAHRRRSRRPSRGTVDALNDGPGAPLRARSSTAATRTRTWRPGWAMWRGLIRAPAARQPSRRVSTAGPRRAELHPSHQGAGQSLGRLDAV